MTVHGRLTRLLRFLVANRSAASSRSSLSRTVRSCRCIRSIDEVLMSLFYTFSSEAEASTDDVRELFAVALGATVAADGTIFVQGMNVTAFRVDPEQAGSAAGYFGFEHRVT